MNEATLDWSAIAKRISYKPNAKLSVEADGEFLILKLVLRVPNAASQEHELIEVTHHKAFNPSWFGGIGVNQALDFIWDFVRKAEIHECDEWFRFDGRMLRDPHEGENVR